MNNLSFLEARTKKSRSENGCNMGPLKKLAKYVGLEGENGENRNQGCYCLLLSISFSGDCDTTWMRTCSADLTCCSFSLISRCRDKAAARFVKSSAEAAVKRWLASTIWARTSFSWEAEETKNTHTHATQARLVRFFLMHMRLKPSHSCTSTCWAVTGSRGEAKRV